ncbi:hypothetical protein ACI6QG_09555 [Roseococcus sp. DSY-14]|uniref:hypothetical protein n=1 Tax=Roseomonadaceae TaxID=3385906 RepID=UPI0011F1B3BF|nr:hypothetical protein [Siccirubricoccus phaeus]
MFSNRAQTVKSLMQYVEGLGQLQRRNDEYAKERTTEAVVVSFHSSWQEKIKKSAFTTILRKRIPLNSRPQRIYFHVNSPIGAICARAKIEDVKTISKSEALNLELSINLTAEKILQYIGNDNQIGAYFVSHIDYAPREAKSSEINRIFPYYPPQSFVSLSSDHEKIIINMCGYSAIAE